MYKHSSKTIQRRLHNDISTKRIALCTFLVGMTMIVPSLLSLQQSASAQFLTLEPGPSSNATSVSSTPVPANTSAAETRPLTIDVILFGVDRKPGNVVTFVTINNLTKAFGGNSAELDKADNVTDGIAEVFFSFPEITPRIGDKFEACSIVVEDRSLTCDNGFKSPTNVTETVQLLVPDEGPKLAEN